MRTRSICVVGLGYVGLPTACMFAARGHDVFGVDIDERVVSELSSGRTSIREPELDTLVHAAINSGRLRCGLTPVAADVFIIAVPTPVGADLRADLLAVESAARGIARVLKSGDLVILESTVPPGTTRDMLRGVLETSGLRVGSDILLAHCPERVLPGNLLVELVSNDRIIGGIDQASTAAAMELYRVVVTGELIETDATTAELVKLMENTHRDVNIALANEFALIAERIGVDVWEAIQLANRHPRVRYLRPGPGVGGHCIAVDPWFVVQAAPELARLITLARHVNDSMPGYVVELVTTAVGELRGATLVALGRTYKADVTDTRESPAVDVIDHLRAAGADVREHDAMVAAGTTVAALAEGADGLVLLVDHSAYRELDPAGIGARMRSRLIVDCRNAIAASAWRNAGFKVVTLGSGVRSAG